MQFITKEGGLKAAISSWAILLKRVLLPGLVFLMNFTPVPVLAVTRDVSLLIPDPLDSKGEPAPIPQDRKRMLDYIGREADVHFELQRCPWKRILLLAEHGEGLVFGISKTGDRERMFHFSRPLYANYVWLVTRRDARFDYKSIADLKGRSVGIVAGTHYGDYFDEQKGKLFKVESDTNSVAARFNKLANRRMDVMVIQDPGSDARDLEERINRYFSKQQIAEGQPLVEFSVLAKPLLVDDIHFAIRADKDDGLIQKIDAAIAKGKKQGILALDLPKAGKQ
ncbi:substrate-binding periplasmic protein [Undibacterium sp. Ji49W]|uniref:substrate-binding periplasmic protein n=1 Tax=Undibacterium sp. Ji49W TaxID=3413040 RepID=UPI003BEF8F88